MTELQGFSEVTAMREMKDSGIEWVGDIPANWEGKKIKFALQERIVKNQGYLDEIRQVESKREEQYC